MQLAADEPTRTNAVASRDKVSLTKGRKEGGRGFLQGRDTARPLYLIWPKRPTDRANHNRSGQVDISLHDDLRYFPLRNKRIFLLVRYMTPGDCTTTTTPATGSEAIKTFVSSGLAGRVARRSSPRVSHFQPLGADAGTQS